MLGIVTLLSLGREPQTWLGDFGILFSSGGQFGGGHGPALSAAEDAAPPPLQHMGLGGDIAGEPWRDKQGRCVEAGKVVRTWSLNLN